MNILALDTATKTGWAVFSSHFPYGDLLDSGVEDFSTRKGAHLGRRFHLFRDWLKDKIRDNKIDLISYEAVVGGRMAGGRTSLVQKGLEAILYEVAFTGRSGCSVPVWSFSPATIKKWATGSGLLTHESKIAMVAFARQEFPDAVFQLRRPTKAQPWNLDDNQCDALHLGRLTCRVHSYINDNEGPPTDDGDEEVIDMLTSVAQIVTSIKWPFNAKKRSKMK